MKPKLFIMLILSVIYIITTIIWTVIDRSFESFIAVIGGFISVVNFYIANNNSFSVSMKIERQINMGKKSTYNEVNSK